MSENVDWIVVQDVPLEEAKLLADQVRNWLVEEKIIMTQDAMPSSRGDQLWRRAWAHKWDADLTFQVRPSHCGLEMAVERRVFDAGGHGIDALVCPACDARHDPDTLLWSDAVGAWHAGDDLSALTCSECGADRLIVDWSFDPPWAFGNVGFGFWNWSIKERLVDEIAAITGHRCRLVRQHI